MEETTREVHRIHERRISVGTDQVARALTADDLRKRSGNWRDLIHDWADDWGADADKVRDFLWKREISIADHFLQEIAWIEKHRPDLLAHAPVIRAEIARESKIEPKGPGRSHRWLSTPMRDSTRADFARELDVMAAALDEPAPAIGNIISAAVAADRYHVTAGHIGLLVRQHELTDHRLPDHESNEAHRVDESAVASRFTKRE